MDWKDELKTIIEKGCTDSDIIDFIDEHSDIDGEDIWDYVYEYNAPKQCKGCEFIQMSGIVPCIHCTRQAKDYYKARQKVN